ncbi:NUDIX domain-containing protein [Micromonospora sp. NPDC048894]|uniref:NUDIX hydrolase n=1 Tax=unclassified Micromonospora TaxID=2617518 RepID=UPI0033E645D0
MQERRRIAAYGWCADDTGRVLLVRGAAADPAPGLWRLPGGGVAHAEHPADTVVRRFTGETGLGVAVGGLRAAVADLSTRRLGAVEVPVHTDRLVFHVTVLDGQPSHGDQTTADGPAELAWCTPQQAATLPLMPFTAELFGLPARPAAGPPGPPGPPPPPPAAGPPTGPAPSDSPAGSESAEEAGSAEVTSAGVEPTADRRQRFAAYGLVTDPDGRVLLTMIAPGYPGAGLWHLPGGGTDHGEQPVDGLLRELVEESGQRGRIDRLMLADNLHNPVALGPEGRPLDWHGVRVIYRVLVDEPTDPVVTEAAGGSTQAAAWFTSAQLSGLAMTDVAELATGRTVG